MIGVHVGLDLEDEAGHLAFVRLHGAAGGGLGSRAGGEFGQRVDKVFDAEILERATPEDWSHMAFEEGLLVESPQALDGEAELFDRLRALVLWQELLRR